MICFQSIIFDILKTTFCYKISFSITLWFAFNLLSLTYWKQHSEIQKSTIYVVICFQSIIFDILKTTCQDIHILAVLLWFAFNLLSLTYWKQHANQDAYDKQSCDLLSIYYLWHTENNKKYKMHFRLLVVICFQSIIFDILKTTIGLKGITVLLLWFAFNLLSLTYWKQHWPTIPLLLLRCDLLSIYYLWHTENNHRQDGYLLLTVVICFQSIIFDILKTTRPSSGESTSMLWFAFNLLSLTYWKQLHVVSSRLFRCCDLLSIYYLWHTENNFL